jgi:hypothetical protein
MGTQVLCSQLTSSVSLALPHAYYPCVCPNILLENILSRIRLNLCVKFVILIFLYALSKRPSEGNFNVLRVSHDAFEAILLLKMSHLCNSHPDNN